MSIQTTPPPASEPGQAETYRPLSLLALGGLALSLAAAAAVLVGGLVPVANADLRLFCASLVLTPLVVVAVAAVRGVRGVGLALAAVGGFAAWALVLGLGGLLLLSRKEPWVLPGWFWALAAGGAVLSWVARGQIKNSENTLSGEGLARLGLIVSGGVAVVYGAYVSSSMLAVQYQARACATGFLEQIQKGEDPYLAFTWTQQPGEPHTREFIDVTYNIPSMPNDATAFTALTQGPLSRLIQMGGEKTKFEERGLRTGYDRGNYQVVLEYRARTPYYTFDFEVATEGKQTDARRVWYVLAGGTKLVETTPPVPTDLGKELAKKTEDVGPLMDTFLLAVAAGTPEALGGAYLLTLPPAQREGKGPKEAKEALNTPGGKEFTAGKMIDLRDASMSPAVRGPAEKLLRQLFDPEAPRTVGSEHLRVYDLVRLPRLAPLLTEVEGGWKLTYPLRLVIRDPAFAMPKYMADLDLIIEGTSAGEPRISGLKVVRVMPPPADKKGPGGPR